MMTDTRTMTCPRCGTDFEQNVGRGRKSPYCDDCRKDIATERAAIRQFAVMSASMIEVSTIYGAQLARRRSEVTERQDGRCRTCARKRRRLFLQEVGGTHVGDCIQCFMRSIYSDD
jgi:hypothetical protein